MLRFTPRSRNMLIALVSVVLFLAGIQTGKSIQRIDQTTPPIIPTPSITPTPAPITFQEVVVCGIKFLLPTTFTQNKGSFTHGDSSVTVMCGGNADAQATRLREDARATDSARVLDAMTTLYISRDSISWSVKLDQKSAQEVHFQATQDIAPLVQRTLHVPL